MASCNESTHSGGHGSGGGGGSIGMATLGGNRAYSYNQFECAHYDRMPIPIPVQIPIVPPPPPMNLHSEEEIEPAYATGTSKR